MLGQQALSCPLPTRQTSPITHPPPQRGTPAPSPASPPPGPNAARVGAASSPSQGTEQSWAPVMQFCGDCVTGTTRERSGCQQSPQSSHGLLWTDVVLGSLWDRRPGQGQACTETWGQGRRGHRGPPDPSPSGDAGIHLPGTQGACRGHQGPCLPQPGWPWPQLPRGTPSCGTPSRVSLTGQYTVTCFQRGHLWQL